MRIMTKEMKYSMKIREKVLGQVESHNYYYIEENRTIHTEINERIGKIGRLYKALIYGKY